MFFFFWFLYCDWVIWYGFLVQFRIFSVYRLISSIFCVEFEPNRIGLFWACRRNGLIDRVIEIICIEFGFGFRFDISSDGELVRLIWLVLFFWYSNVAGSREEHASKFPFVAFLIYRVGVYFVQSDHYFCNFFFCLNWFDISCVLRVCFDWLVLFGRVENHRKWWFCFYCFDCHWYLCKDGEYKGKKKENKI